MVEGPDSVAAQAGERVRGALGAPGVATWSVLGELGLPPVRLHDLRHGAASLAHTAGADLKTIQDQLGHASIVLTADTYTSVLPDTQRKAAEATARLVLTAARIRPRPHDRTPAHQQDPPQAGPDSHAADAAGRTIPSPAVDASTWTNIAYHAQTEAAVTFGRSTRRAPT